MSRVYFVTNYGTLLEFDKIEPSDYARRRIAPANGCDMIVQGPGNSLQCSSACSKSYRDTPEDALRDFIAKQHGYVEQTKRRLAEEGRILAHARKQLAEATKPKPPDTTGADILRILLDDAP